MGSTDSTKGEGGMQAEIGIGRWEESPVVSASRAHAGFEAGVLLRTPVRFRQMPRWGVARTRTKNGRIEGVNLPDPLFSPHPALKDVYLEYSANPATGLRAQPRSAPALPPPFTSRLIPECPS